MIADKNADVDVGNDDEAIDEARLQRVAKKASGENRARTDRRAEKEAAVILLVQHDERANEAAAEHDKKQE